MWTRKELKEKGKAAFKRNYWACVLAALILSVLMGGASGLVTQKINVPARNDAIAEITSINPEQLIHEAAVQNNMTDMQAARAIAIGAAAIAGLVGVIAFVGGLLKIFVWNVLEVGGCGFFAHNAKEKAGVGEIFSAFSHGYGHNVVVMFLRNLFISLWTLLFIIPGIVKSYSYRLVPYIMAENPEMGWGEASRMSRDLMKGNKWKAFVLDLSFIGWKLLGALTLGLLDLFYVAPYVQATNAELYHALRNPQEN